MYGSFVLADTIKMVYGNAGKIYREISLPLLQQNACNSSAVDRMGMFHAFKAFNNHFNWEATLEFGLSEKIVTARTSYIVLERIEDYIRHNITPPKELEQECMDRGFVKQDTKT